MATTMTGGTAAYVESKRAKRQRWCDCSRNRSVREALTIKCPARKMTRVVFHDFILNVPIMNRTDLSICAWISSQASMMCHGC